MPPFQFIRFPVPVTVAQGFWDTVGQVATIVGGVAATVAIGVALWTIRRTNQIADNADEALVRERRYTYELGLIARIVEICGHNPPGSIQVLQGLLLMLPNEEDLPKLKDKIRKNMVPSNDALKDHLEEFQQAVNRRLATESIRPKKRSLRKRATAEPK